MQNVIRSHAVKGRSSIGDHIGFEVQVASHTRRRFDAAIGHKAGDKERIDSCAMEPLFKIRAHKGAVDTFLNNRLMWQWAHDFSDLDSGCAGPEERIGIVFNMLKEENGSRGLAPCVQKGSNNCLGIQIVAAAPSGIIPDVLYIDE